MSFNTLKFIDLPGIITDFLKWKGKSRLNLDFFRGTISDLIVPEKYKAISDTEGGSPEYPGIFRRT